MEEKDFKKFTVPFMIILLAIPSFFIIRPIIIAIALGLTLAYLFYPVYTKLMKKLKSKYLSATIILVISVILIVLPIIILIPMTARQVVDVYAAVSQFEVYPALNKIAPFLLENPVVSTELQAASSQIKTALSGWILSFMKDLIVQLPEILLGIIVVLFTFFFSLIESDKFRDYFSVVFPFPKQYQDKFYEKFDQVTNSVLYGELIVGVTQGLIAGIGYVVLGVPKALLLTIATIIASIIPIIGPWLIWVPVDVYLFAQGHTGLAMGLLIYGLFVVNWVDTLLRPQIVSSKTEMNSAIALIGTVGGLYAFGLIGILIGPLVLAYIILLIEIYRDKGKEPSIVLREENPAETKPA